MNTLRKIKLFLPIIFLLILLFILWKEMIYANPQELPSALIGEDIPKFSLPNLYDPLKSFTPNDFPQQVVLLNVWATWCYACSLEHSMLLKIKNQYHIPIFGIDYKDNPQTAKTWLQQHGNPYELIGSDLQGDAAIDLGVYGTPETYVITSSGKIIYRHVGAINQKVWDEVLFPLIKQYGNPS